MQPYTEDLSKSQLTDQTTEVVIGKQSYLAQTGPHQGWVRERGPGGEKIYPMVHAMGGKNIFYFLTPLERGRLQVLPVAYDLRRKNWYDTAASGVRHFSDRRDEALAWTDRMFTFNSTCFDCHVSQMATQYDVDQDTYQTTWLEPGINCESCHGPSNAHVSAAEALAKGQPLEDLKIIRTKTFQADKMNDLCATCHAKMIPLSASYKPGDKFFDHYDLIALEHSDFYPDGRDLGENYTYTSWLMSSCLKSGKLDCNHCHTPSGRNRFQGEQANQACLPCHAEKVKNPTAHTHHLPQSAGNRCISCHMPQTGFAAMARSDHSLLPPTPAATLVFQSPNACNLCHQDRDARWADGFVRKWAKRDYQKPVLNRASLIEAARKRDFKRLPEMLALVSNPATNQILKVSLVRLLTGCLDERKWPVLIRALKDSSPLVRAAAVSELNGHDTAEARAALLEAAADPLRLVRIRAASVLARTPREGLSSKQKRDLDAATEDFLGAMRARPDDWASYANLGNYFLDSQQVDKAIHYFETATRIEPCMIGPWINLSLAYNAQSRNDLAESSLRKALAIDPGNASANFNMGLLLAEMGKNVEAEKALRTAFTADPTLAAAAYNLSVLVSRHNLAEAIDLARQAVGLRPREFKYVQSLNYFLTQQGDLNQAAVVWRNFIRLAPAEDQAYLELGKVLEASGKTAEAKAIYQQGLSLHGKARPMPISP
jgi:tetratricopeptide (TPR) repeat protein